MTANTPSTPWLPEQYDIITDHPEILYRCKEDDDRLQCALLENMTVQEADFSGLCVTRTEFRNCRFLGCSFEKAEFQDVMFRSCNVSNSNFSDSFLNRAAFASSKGTGMKLAGSSCKDVRMTDCSMEFANFDASKLEMIAIENSDLGSSNFAQCKCRGVSWSGVNLRQVSFFKTPLKGMDFTTCVIDGLVLSDECSELKGAIVDFYQAVELAKRLGLVIK